MRPALRVWHALCRLAASTEVQPLTYEHCALFINAAELAAREIERDALQPPDASADQSIPSPVAR